jgi:hypothetical protein
MSYEQENERTAAIPLEELKELAAAVASEMSSQDMNPALRARFIQVRTALFRRGIFDPVLVRFDSATAPRASAQEVGEQLASVATNL